MLPYFGEIKLYRQSSSVLPGCAKLSSTIIIILRLHHYLAPSTAREVFVFGRLCRCSFVTTVRLLARFGRKRLQNFHNRSATAHGSRLLTLSQVRRNEDDSNEQVALLSQEAARCFYLYSFNSTIPRAQSFIYLRQRRRYMFCPCSFVCLSVCLSVSKITQKGMHGFG